MTQPADKITLEVKFPLADGRTLVQGPLAYNQDGLATQHNADFMRDPRFLEAYRHGLRHAGAAHLDVDDDLLLAFELEKAVYEFAYAATYLPSWTEIALEGLEGLLAWAKESTSR